MDRNFLKNCSVGRNPVGVKKITLRHLALGSVALLLAACGRPEVSVVRPERPSPTPPPTIVSLPPPPALPPKAHDFLLSQGGRGLILEFETGGKSGYDPHPEW